jgi:hypothetical protein
MIRSIDSYGIDVFIYFDMKNIVFLGGYTSMSKRIGSIICLLAVCLIAAPAFAQVGGFTNSVDIGDVGAAGSSSFNEIDTDIYEYEVKGSGADIWEAADEFHFVYKEIEGDFSIVGRPYLFVDSGNPEWAKAGLMVRNNLTAGSAFAFAMIRALGQDYAPQWRDTQDTDAAWDDSTLVPGTDIMFPEQEGAIEIERRGNTFTFYYIATETGERTLVTSHHVPDMQDPVYVGLAVTSHEDGGISTGAFTNVGVVPRSFNVYETFSYPFDTEGDALASLPEQGGLGWASGWEDSGAASPNALDSEVLQAGLVENQPAEFNPGGYSARITGDAGDGVGRKIEPENAGDLWISFVFKEEGPAVGHWSGMTIFASDGSESSFLGKPYDSATAGIGNLPDGDSLTDVDYTVPNHFLVRIDMDPTPGQNDSVYLWINPDETDRTDTYDAGGPKNDDILDIAEIRLRRGGADGSSYFDSIWISTDPALPPAGAGRVDLTFNNPDRDPALPVWDVISIDKYDDGITGVPGFGHDNGNNYYMVVSGYIYEDGSGTASIANGLPPDRMSGLNGHVFGPYNNASLELGLKNSMKFQNNAEQQGPFTFDVVPPGKYKELRSAMTVGNGYGVLKTTLNFEDGTTEVTEIHADDWFRDPTDNNWQFIDVSLLINGMDRLDGGSNFADANDPAVNEDVTPINPDKVLVSVTLELDLDNSGNGGDVGYNLYDIWAFPAGGEPTAVADWSLF